MELVDRARAIHLRLMNPPNAVHDDGIDLKKKVRDRNPIKLKFGPLTPYTRPRGCPTLEDLTRIVCEHYNVPPEDLEGARRTQALVRPRQVWAYLAHHETATSYPLIGRYLGGRDHSTAVHAAQRIEFLIGRDPEFALEMESIKHKLEQLFSIRSSIVCIDPREF